MEDSGGYRGGCSSIFSGIIELVEIHLAGRMSALPLDGATERLSERNIL